MSERDTAQEILIIGLGGLGIRTAITLRAALEQHGNSGPQERLSKIRLRAIDSRPNPESYLSVFEGHDPEGFSLDSTEYFGLLKPNNNPWDKVIEDAKLKVTEAEKLAANKPVIEISRTPDRFDYRAMIYESKERYRLEVRKFLNESTQSENFYGKPPKIVVITSLFGDAGSLAYLELLSILEEISSEFKFESVNSYLISPEGFEGIFRLNDYQTAKYFSMVDSIYRLNLNELIQKFSLNQQLLMVNEKNFEEKYIDLFMILNEVSIEIYSNTSLDLNVNQISSVETLNQIIRLELLDNEKCLEIKKIMSDRCAVDPIFFEHIRHFAM